MTVDAAEAGIEDVTNERELYAWLSSQPAQFSRAMAARGALRSLPAVMNQVERTAGNVNAGASLIACLRATMVACVAANEEAPSPELKDAAQAATSAAPRMYPSVTDRTATLAGMSAAETVLNVSKSSVADAASQALQLASDTARSSTLTAGLTPFNSEATMLKDAQDGQEVNLLETRLWSTGKAPLPMLEFWEGFVRAAKNDAIWDYWVEWYQGFLSGRPIDWEFQGSVAQIPDSIWREGAEAVATEIERLRAAIAAAQAARAAAEAKAAQAEAEAKAAAEKAKAEAEARLKAAMPASVDHLLNNRILATAVLDGAATALRATQANAVPGIGAQAALTDLPRSLAQISAQLRSIPTNSATDLARESLRTDVAKFNLSFDVLEKTLNKLVANTCAPEDRNAVTPILNNPVVLGNLIGGLLILAGPDAQLMQRYEYFTSQWQTARKAA